MLGKHPKEFFVVLTANGGPTVRPGRRFNGGWVTYGLLVVLALIYTFPFLVQLATSFKTEPEAAANPLGLLPSTWSGAAYESLFANSDFPSWTMNSLLVTVLVTAGRVFFDSLAGYALARLQFRGRTVVFAILVGVMAVPGVVLLIPKFLVLNQLACMTHIPAWSSPSWPTLPECSS